MIRFSQPTRSKIAALFLGCLLALLAGEVFVRIWKRDIAYQPDPELIRSLRPNVELEIYSYDTEEALKSFELPERMAFLGVDSTNNLGFRMKEDVGAKGKDERRILLLGDSFTEAVEMPDPLRFYSLVDRALEEPGGSGPRWRVVNGAIQNGCPSQYVLQLRKFLPLVEPDLVIVVFGANDLSDDLQFERTYGFRRDSEGLPTGVERTFRLRLLRASWLLRYFEVALRRGLPALYDAVTPPVSTDVPDISWQRFYCTADEESLDVFRGRTGRYLLELHRMAESANAAFGVFHMHYLWLFENEPFYAERFPRDFLDELEEWGCGAKDLRRHNEAMERFFSRNAVRYYNPYASLEEAKAAHPEVKLWNFYDYHLSSAGHALIAREMTKFVRQIFLEP